MKQHYNKEYFDWHKQISRFGAKANKFKFENEINKSDHVLDFGCGGGYLLSGLDCDKKYGIEINPPAIEEAKKNGIEVYSKH